MVVSRLFSSLSRNVGRRALLLSAAQKHQVPLISNQLHSLADGSRNKIVTCQIPLLNHLGFNPFHFQRFGMSSFAIHEPTEKEHGRSAVVDTTNADQRKASDSVETEATDQKNESGSFSESQTTMSQTAGYRLDDRVIRPAEVGVTQPLENKGFIRLSWKAITSLPLRVFNFITHYDLLNDTLNYYEKKGVLVAVEVGILGAKVTPVLRGDELQKEVVLVAVEVGLLRAKVTPVLHQK